VKKFIISSNSFALRLSFLVILGDGYQRSRLWTNRPEALLKDRICQKPSGWLFGC